MMLMHLCPALEYKDGSNTSSTDLRGESYPVGGGRVGRDVSRGGLKKIPDQDEERADVDDSERILEERKINTHDDSHYIEDIKKCSTLLQDDLDNNSTPNQLCSSDEEGVSFSKNT
uniref:Uncharacterized protein n=1 Tax=Timema bartmani TaxID=61472 RepID=A0A7R9F4S8_9NEOP|nr:unnamed protein product [Timema bartmani]